MQISGKISLADPPDL